MDLCAPLKPRLYPKGALSLRIFANNAKVII
jgi:hypothetical protein